MATKVGWDLELLQKKREDSVKVKKKTATGTGGEAEKDSGMARVEGTSKYGKLHYRVTLYL